MTRIGIEASTISKNIDEFITTCSKNPTDPTYKTFIESSSIYSGISTEKDAFYIYGRYPLVLLNKEIVNIHINHR